MTRDNCRVCGGVIERGVASCPHCGARLGQGLSRIWILTFFVMGVVIGLLLLVLQGGQLPSWFGVPGPAASPHVVPPPGGSTRVPRPGHVSEAPRPAAGSAPVIPAPRPATATDRAMLVPMQCNREAAQGVRDKAGELAQMRVQGGVLQLYLGGVWEFYTPGVRRSFVETFAEADRCLQGGGRPIRFSFRGSEVAAVSAEGAVEMR